MPLMFTIKVLNLVEVYETCEYEMGKQSLKVSLRNWK